MEFTVTEFVPSVRRPRNTWTVTSEFELCRNRSSGGSEGNFFNLSREENMSRCNWIRTSDAGFPTEERFCLIRAWFMRFQPNLLLNICNILKFVCRGLLLLMSHLCLFEMWGCNLFSFICSIVSSSTVMKERLDGWNDFYRMNVKPRYSLSYNFYGLSECRNLGRS